MATGTGRHPIQDASCNSPKSFRDNAKRLHPTSPLKTRVAMIGLVLAALVGLMLYSDYRGHRLLEPPTSAGAKLQQPVQTD